MDVHLTRIPEDGTPNRCAFRLPEGMIEVVGTPGFVVGAIKALLAPGTTLHHLMMEHNDPEDLRDAWAQATRDAGLDPDALGF